MDVIEKLNMTVTTSGNVVKSEVVGRVFMKTQLTGMPILKLGLNDKVLFERLGKAAANTVDLEDIKFHNCVDLAQFDNDRTITFIPPDGEFDLMTYRLGIAVKPLFYIDVKIKETSSNKMELNVSVSPILFFLDESAVQIQNYC